MLVPFSALGIVLDRSVLTRFVVGFSAGPFLEIALKYPVVPAWSSVIGVTAATPAVEATSFCSVCRRGSPVRGSLVELEDELLEELGPELERRLSRRPELDRNQQRAIDARTEVLRDQVVRPPRGGRGRQRRRVLLAERQRQQWDRQRNQDRERCQAGDHGSLGDFPAHRAHSPFLISSSVAG